MDTQPYPMPQRRRSWWRTIVTLAVIGGLYYALFVHAPPQGQQYARYYEGPVKGGDHKAVEGFVPPDFTLPDLSGRLHRLEDYRGKAVLVSFWAPWCAPCRKEAPGMVRLWRKLRGEGFEVLAVATSYRSAVEVKTAARSLDMDFPVLLDEDGHVADQWVLSGLPGNFLLDRHGVLRLYTGPHRWDTPDTEALVRKALQP